MTELFVLVNRPVAGQAQQTVNARELHAFLGNRGALNTPFRWTWQKS